MNKDNKAKLIVASVIIFVVMLMSVYIVSVYGGSGKANPGTKHVSFAAPELEKKEYEYNRRIDLVNAKAKQSATVTKATNETELDIDIPEMETNPFLIETNETVQQTETESHTEKNMATSVVKISPTNKVVNRTQKDDREASAVIQESAEQDPVRRRKVRYLNVSENSETASKKVSMSIPCRIYGEHKVTNNSKIKARITEDVVIDNVKIKRNTIVTGIAQLTSTKVNIRFETIQYENKTIPVNMKAYSRDGLEGIYIEGGVGDDVKKDVYDDILDAASPSTVDRIPIVGDILKTTTKKQNNRVYVDIPNDYTIYLRK